MGLSLFVENYLYVLVCNNYIIINIFLLFVNIGGYFEIFVSGF